MTKLRFGPPDAAGDRAVVGLDVALGADGDAGPPPRTARVALGDGATVVLAAGAVLTPHLLQRAAASRGRFFYRNESSRRRSGVGDRDTLEAAGLETIVANDGVGVGLQDHPAVAVVYDVDPALTADMAGLYGRFLNWTRGKPFGSYSRAFGSASRRPRRRSREFDRGNIRARRRFGYPGFSAGAFLHSGGDEAKPPDLQLTVFPVRIEPHLEERREGRASAARVRFDQAIVTVAVVRPDTAYAVVPGGAGPTLELLPHRVPYADGGGIDDRDVARLAAGVRRVREIFARAPLRDFVLREDEPGTEPGDLHAWVRSHFTANSHWCCSAHFGAGGALRPRDLRVRGAANLHVADSSSFPAIPNGNVHSTVVAVAAEAAERLADGILGVGG